MKRRYLFWALGVVLAVVVIGAGIYFSQQNKTCDTSIPVDEDIQNAMAFGRVFEAPLWTAESGNYESNVSVLWRDETGLGHLDYLRYNCGLRKVDLEQYRFDISLSGYDRYTETAKCEADDLYLREFDTVSGGADYRTRFWLKPVNDTRLAAFQLSFPVSRAQDLDFYSARLFPGLSGCG